MEVSWRSPRAPWRSLPLRGSRIGGSDRASDHYLGCGPRNTKAGPPACTYAREHQPPRQSNLSNSSACSWFDHLLSFPEIEHLGPDFIELVHRLIQSMYCRLNHPP